MKSIIGEIKKHQRFSGSDEGTNGTHAAPDNFHPLTEECPGSHSLYSFGHGYYGRLGNGSSGYYDILSLSKILCFEDTDILSVKMSSAHVLVLLSTGKIYSFGKCHFGQLGLGYEWMDAFTPQHIPLKVSIKVISTGTHHSLAIDHEGRAYSWGCGFSGALGHGDEVSRTTPTLVSSLLGPCLHIAGGEAHSLALLSIPSAEHSTVYSWGKGAQGQLGNGQTSNLLLPHEVSFFRELTVQSVGARHDLSYALVALTPVSPCAPSPSNSFQLFTWGSNSHGQLGHHCDASQSSFLISVEDVACLKDNRIPDKSPGSLFPGLVESPLSAGWKRVATGGQHCLGVDLEDNIFGWGYGPAFGLFDNDFRTCITWPQHLPSPPHSAELSHSSLAISDISCGTRHSLLSFNKGSTYAIGANNSGQLGTGDREWRDHWTPVDMSLLGDHRKRCVGSAGGTNSTVLILETL
jgi:alpha-tubulin suppressor-like RCC1 family protein